MQCKRQQTGNKIVPEQWHPEDDNGDREFELKQLGAQVHTRNFSADLDMRGQRGGKHHKHR